MMMRPSLLVAVLATAVCCCLAASGPVSKALSGPPNEFPSHELPVADSNGVSADSAAYFIVFSDDTPIWKRSLNVDASQFGFSVYSPGVALFTVTLNDPEGNAVDIGSSAVPVDFPISDDSTLNSQFSGTFYTVLNAKTGDYQITVSVNSHEDHQQLKSLLQNSAVKEGTVGMVFLYNDSPDYIFTHLSDYQTIVGKSLGLGTRMYDALEYQRLQQEHLKNHNNNSSSAGRPVLPPPTPKYKQDMISDANMEVVYPDGHIEVVPMHDDGLHNDGLANDGEYGATFLPVHPGQYVMQASLQGNNGVSPFIRTTQHFVQVVEQTVKLTGKAFATLHLLEQRVALHFEIQPASDAPANQLYRIYAEVYGVHQKSKAIRPAAWVSTITTVQAKRGKQVLSAEIDLAWFAKAGVEGPITIKNAYVQDVATMVPLSYESNMDMFTPPMVRQHISKTVNQLLASGYKGEVTKVMLEGVPPVRSSSSNNGSAADNGNGKLVVLHGYCAQKNPFSTYPEDWTNAVFYSDPGKGIGVDEYARNVMAFVEAQGLTSFGLVGHSQGGMVSLHIMNYYHTGLDLAKGNRKIQSLASPFMGNSAAGSADNMKKLFGLGCGTVNELTVDGATAWLTGISATAISQLNYYTTQYDKGGLFGNGWCNMVMNTQLDNPNDGATELSRARLNGAINRGHTIGQCHTDGMKWPASYFDHARNAEMNANAAR